MCYQAHAVIVCVSRCCSIRLFMVSGPLTEVGISVDERVVPQHGARGADLIDRGDHRA